MKRISGLPVGMTGSAGSLCAALLLFVAGVGHPLLARADSGGSDCYQAFPEWDQVVELHGKVDEAEGIGDETKEPLDSRFNELQVRHDSYYDGTADLCAELRNYNNDKGSYEQELAEYNKEFDAHQQEAAEQHAECPSTVDTQEQADRCNEWGARITADAERLDAWAAQINQKKSDLDQRVADINGESDRLNAEWTGLLDSYIADAQAALDEQGFTGRKVYRMTAKSWIDTAAVTEYTIRGLKFHLESNDTPTSPYLNGGNDFKLFQTFTVQVDFVNGKVKSAEFLKDSLQAKAGSTYLLVPVPGPGTAHLMKVAFQGRIYVTDQKIDKATDEESVTFTRTVEGHPNEMILYPDYFTPGSTNFTPIYNTLKITVKADGDPDVEGSGSAFPSHMFWLGDQLFDQQQQVQPSEYFGGH